MIRRDFWVLVCIMCIAYESMANADKTEVEKHYTAHFGEHNKLADTFWVEMFVITNFSQQKFEYNVCSAAYSCMLESIEGSKQPSTSEPTSIRSCDFKMEASLRITGVATDRAIQVLTCNPDGGDPFEITRGRKATSVYFVQPLKPGERVTSSTSARPAGYILDDRFTEDVDLQAKFDIAQTARNVVASQNLPEGSWNPRRP